MKRRWIAFGLVALVALAVAGVATAHQVTRIKGTHNDDQLTGTPTADLIRALAGNDTVSALDGNDRIIAGPGNDSVDAGPGNDWAHGGPGNDTLAGGDGNDRLRGGQGDDTVDGGPGNDRLHSGSGADTLIGGDGDDVLFMVVNDDTVDHADCGAGHDTVWINANEADVNANCETVKTVTVSPPLASPTSAAQEACPGPASLLPPEDFRGEEAALLRRVKALLCWDSCAIAVSRRFVTARMRASRFDPGRPSGCGAFEGGVGRWGRV